MKKLKIITGADNPILRAVSEPVISFDDDLRKFVKQMDVAMVAAKGLGIAAPQVGRNVRVFLAVLNYGEKDQMTVSMVNPQIVSHSANKELGEEGCLSLPGIYGQVERFRELVVEFVDLEGAQHSLTLDGLNARVVQHENDHINGILFIDRIQQMEEKEGLAF